MSGSRAKKIKKGIAASMYAEFNNPKLTKYGKRQIYERIKGVYRAAKKNHTRGTFHQQITE